MINFYFLLMVAEGYNYGYRNLRVWVISVSLFRHGTLLFLRRYVFFTFASGYWNFNAHDSGIFLRISYPDPSL